MAQMRSNPAVHCPTVNLLIQPQVAAGAWMSGRLVGGGLGVGMSIDPDSSLAAGVLRDRLRFAAIESQAARDKAAKVLAAAAAVDPGVGGFGSLAFINDVVAAVAADGEACLLSEFSRWADCAGDGELFVELSGMLWDRLSAAPGDEWSGRGNDLRRAYRDGQLAACKRLRTELRLAGVETGR